MRKNMKNPLSLRKRAVPRSKLQLGHHYIWKPADASLWVRGIGIFTFYLQYKSDKNPAVNIIHEDLG
jgi:hypothetical protein